MTTLSSYAILNALTFHGSRNTRALPWQYDGKDYVIVKRSKLFDLIIAHDLSAFYLRPLENVTAPLNLWTRKIAENAFDILWYLARAGIVTDPPETVGQISVTFYAFKEFKHRVQFSIDWRAKPY